MTTRLGNNYADSDATGHSARACIIEYQESSNPAAVFVT